MVGLEHLEMKRAALNMALAQAQQAIAPLLAEVRARLAEFEEALRPTLCAPSVKVDTILRLVAAESRIEPEEILSKSRISAVVEARAATVWVAAQVTDYSYSRLGKALPIHPSGPQRDHTTIMGSIAAADKRRARDSQFRDWTDQLVRVFSSTSETKT